MGHFLEDVRFLEDIFLLKKWQVCHHMCVPLVGYCMIYNNIIMSSYGLVTTTKFLVVLAEAEPVFSDVLKE